MTDLTVHRFHGGDDVELAWREVGEGRPLVLLHGLMGSDTRSASAGELAGLLPNGRLVLIPGDHLGVIGAPELIDAVVDFLG